MESDRRGRALEAAVARVGRLEVPMIVVPIIVIIVIIVPMIVIVVPIIVIVVPIIVIVVRTAATLRHLVVVAVDPTAELHAKAPQAQLFVGEGREGRQVGPRRQRLDSGGLEVPDLRPDAEPPRQTGRLALVEVGANDVGAVVVAGADALPPALALELVMVPIDDVQAEPRSLDEAVVEALETDVEPPGAPLPVECDRRLAMFVPCPPDSPSSGPWCPWNSPANGTP